MVPAERERHKKIERQIEAERKRDESRVNSLHKNHGKNDEESTTTTTIKFFNLKMLVFGTARRTKLQKILKYVNMTELIHILDGYFSFFACYLRRFLCVCNVSYVLREWMAFESAAYVIKYA